MKILVTGGAGFIGFHLSKRLAEENNHVTILDNLSRGRLDSFFKKLVSKKNVKFVKADLTQQRSFKKLGKFDQVFHLAAINGTKNFYEKPEEVIRVNTLAALNTLDWAAKNPPKKIVFASSSETYAGLAALGKLKIPTPENVPLVVEDEFNPRWSYGASKIIGELAFINYAKKYGFDYSIVRYHNVYGPRMGFDHVVPEFIGRIKRKENPFKIFGGKQKRAFCYVSDAVAATIAVSNSKKANSQVFNIGANDEIRILELAKTLFALTEFYPKIKLLKPPKGSVARRCPDISKLKKTCGFSPKISLNKGLLKTLDYYLAVN
ncbi:MAG: SDR family NAD(P)-dependent oxidoreductase [archaeon]